MKAVTFVVIYVFTHCAFAAQSAEDEGFPAPDSTESYNWSVGARAEKTFLFTNVHWWESADHQMTSIITLLAVAKNMSAVAVIPFLPSNNASQKSSQSLIGDYFDLEEVRKVQPAVTYSQFLVSEDYRKLAGAKPGSIPFPKDSQEEYESRLGIFGRLRDTVVTLPMAPVDPENTNQPCDRFPGTIHVSADGKARYVFFDPIHFLHFCTEKFMPWWYDVRLRIMPRKEYLQVAERFLSENSHPISAIHISDLMEAQKAREDEEIQRYARQIVDALRRRQAIRGSMYLMYMKEGRNVRKVVKLLKQEFDSVRDCSHVFSCGKNIPRDLFKPPLSDTEFKNLFSEKMGMTMIEWALASSSDYFLGNVHSPSSRNVCLYRKTNGKPYSILKGFGELRKIWKWNL